MVSPNEIRGIMRITTLFTLIMIGKGRQTELLPTAAVINIMVVPVNMTFIILHQKWERISKGGEVIEKSTKKGESG